MIFCYFFGNSNIYRVFTDDYISLSGIKVPYLYVKNDFKKNKIFDLMRILSKETSIGFYIIQKYLQNNFDILCEFMENGNIRIKVDCPILITKDQAEILIKKAVNENVLTHIVNYLKQSGYDYNIFTSFFDENVVLSGQFVWSHSKKPVTRSAN